MEVENTVRYMHLAATLLLVTMSSEGKDAVKKQFVPFLKTIILLLLAAITVT